MFASRWLLAPLYIGLMAALLMLIVKFAQTLIVAIPRILSMDVNETILTALKLIDLAFVGNLLLTVMLSGWVNFIDSAFGGASKSDLAWLELGKVKLTLVPLSAAIAAVQILETFVYIDRVQKADAMWQLAIMLGIGVLGVLLALMDRLSDH